MDIFVLTLVSVASSVGVLLLISKTTSISDRLRNLEGMVKKIALLERRGLHSR